MSASSFLPMIFTGLVLLPIAASSAPAVEALRVEQEIRATGLPQAADGVQSQVIMLAPRRARIDTGSQTILLDASSGGVAILDHDRRTVLTIPFQAASSLMGAMGALQGGGLGAGAALLGGLQQARLEPTGREKTIQGHKTREVALDRDLADMGRVTIRAWVASDLALPEGTLELLGGALGPLGGSGSLLDAAGGIPLASRIQIRAMGQEFTLAQAVRSVETVEATAVAFAVPRDYEAKQLDLGSILQGLQESGLNAAPDVRP